MSSYLEAPAVRFLTRMGLTPNVITLLGLGVAGASAYLLSVGQLVAGGMVFLASGVLDLLDGAVARATGRVSAFGALLDSVTDRVSEAVVMLGLLIYYVGQPSSWGLALVFTALAGSFIVSYVRARAEAIGVECDVGVMTRPERVAVLGVALIAGGWWPQAVLAALGVISALTLVTTVQRVLHVRRVLAQEESGEASLPKED